MSIPDRPCRANKGLMGKCLWKKQANPSVLSLIIIMIIILLDKERGILYSKTMGKIIPITELRRNFGSITADLVETGPIVLTKDGYPFAVLEAHPDEKRKVLLSSAGSLKRAGIDKNIWKEVLKRKSRKKPIAL